MASGGRGRGREGKERKADSVGDRGVLQAAAEILQNESKVFKIVSSLVRSLAGKNFLAKIICMLQQTNMKSLCNFLFSLGCSSLSLSLSCFSCCIFETVS